MQKEKYMNHDSTIKEQRMILRKRRNNNKIKMGQRKNSITEKLRTDLLKRTQTSNKENNIHVHAY